ncbi:hypothetical protein Trydic_g7112 [Trypoxylus dichotomus]
MERCILLCCAFVVLLHIVLATRNDNIDHMEEAYFKRAKSLPILYSKPKESLPLWFGPRIGRSKRSANDIDTEPYGELNCEQIQSLVKFLALLYNSKCQPYGKNRGFSPRLGRDSEEEEYSTYF